MHVQNNNKMPTNFMCVLYLRVKRGIPMSVQPNHAILELVGQSAVVQVLFGQKVMDSQVDVEQIRLVSG